MKTQINGSLQIKPLFVLMVLLLIGTKGFSQTPKALRAFVVDSKSYGDITLSMNDLNANTSITIFIEKSVNGGAYSVVGSFSSQPSQPNPTYIATGLAASTPYCFRARARNSAGVYSEYSQEACATTNALPVPLGLVATETGPNSVRLNWTSYGGKDSGVKVAIERSTGSGGPFVQIGTADGEYGTYTDNNGLSPATQYCYRIRGIWGAAGNSGYSNTACATTRQTAPAAPSGLIAQSLDPTFQIQLNWIDGSGNETGFVIERGTDGVNFSQIVTVGANVTQYNNTGLPASTRYFYRVRAFNNVGSSGYTNVADATTNASPPTAPGNLSVITASESQLNLSWTDNSGNESGFEIERSQDGTNFSKIADAEANATSYPSNGLSPNTQYWYRVRAKNNGGNSGYSNVASAATRDVAPNAPQNLSVTPITNKQIDLSWTDITGTFGLETGYEVERSSDGTAFAKIADVAANQTTYQSTGLNTLTKYWYRIRAKNAIGYSPYSNVAETTTFDVPPVSPTDLTATTASSSQINLVWKDNSSNESVFDIERSTDGTSFSKVGEAVANSSAFQNTGLTPATKYWYRVRSRNSQGASDPTNVATATTRDVIPNNPSDLVASVIDYFSVKLNWSDNSGNERNFTIERSTDGSNFVYVDSVGRNITTFSNKGLKDQTTYYFRIRALNAIGYSGYSNVAVVTTPKAPLPARPENLKATAIDFDLVRLTWDAVSPNTKTVIVERSESADKNFTEIRRVPYPGRVLDDREILDVTDHYYRIKAINDAGASPYSDIVKLSANAIITGAEPAADEDLAYVHGKILYVRLGRARPGRLLLYDMRGVVAQNLKLSQNMQVDLRTFGPGLYIAVIDDNQKIIRRKVLVH
jgi:titin